MESWANKKKRKKERERQTDRQIDRKKKKMAAIHRVLYARPDCISLFVFIFFPSVLWRGWEVGGGRRRRRRRRRRILAQMAALETSFHDIPIRCWRASINPAVNN